MGLPRERTAELFEHIVDFSELREVIDHQVKTYSSGMFVRLAFAVAVSTDPDILVVDEALAVGDAAFQRKCFARIQKIRENGGTILMVSHSAQAVIELCDRAILLDNGDLLLDGDATKVVNQYHKMIYAPAERIATVRQQLLESSDEFQGNSEAGLANGSSHDNDGYDPSMNSKSVVRYEQNRARIGSPAITRLDGTPVNRLVRGRDYQLRYEVEFLSDAYAIRFGSLLKTLSGQELGGIVSHSPSNGLEVAKAGEKYTVAFNFRCALHPGTYFSNVGVVGILEDKETYLDRIIDALMFEVLPEKDLLITGTVDFSCPDVPSVLFQRSSDPH